MCVYQAVFEKWQGMPGRMIFLWDRWYGLWAIKHLERLSHGILKFRNNCDEDMVAVP